MDELIDKLFAKTGSGAVEKTVRSDPDP